jgi:protein-L-isoaspartate(D-aspartate) O-methyltransferase
VLLVGTGSGFLTACLAHLARSVVSIDIHADMIERARSRLEASNLTCVRLEHADVLSFDPGRSFDAIAITGAVDTLPTHFLQWLKPGGRLFVVEGQSPVQQAIRVTRRGESGFARESLFETDIPYLHGAAPKPRFVL